MRYFAENITPTIRHYAQFTIPITLYYTEGSKHSRERELSLQNMRKLKQPLNYAFEQTVKAE